MIKLAASMQNYESPDSQFSHLTFVHISYFAASLTNVTNAEVAIFGSAHKNRRKLKWSLR